ncbi:acidic repeat-containing protein-like [Helianthus annuus]|uniref:acidic repeat-containing protein-like n=1 Tax=Helianthus annuus TaxID=4232 RepID=UPI000B8F29DA|nr:acidic repeat-containing protein-like [Helianthus annuus]
MKESSSNSDSVKITNFSSLCAESVRTEEESKEDDESHQSATNNVVSDKNDYACDKNDCVENADNIVNVKNDVAGESDVSSEEFETSLSNNSENLSDNSEYHTCTSESLNDTSDAPCNNDDFEVTNCDNERFTVEQGSSDDLGNQLEDSGIPDNELKSSNVSDCDSQSDSCSIAREESQVVFDTDYSSSELPESSNAENSEVDQTKEETSIESNSAEIHENMKPMEKESMEIDSIVESDDETIEEIIMETLSVDTPENMVSEEKGSVKVTSTDSSTDDPKGDLNKTESTESVPSKRKRSRRNRRPKRKNAKRENSNLKQTEPKLKGIVEDTNSCADSCKAGSSKKKHAPKHSVTNKLKRRDQFSRITQAELDVFFSKRQTCFNCGIPGHIVRNCVHRPYYSRNTYNQKAILSSFIKHQCPMARPSDRDWNLAKQEKQKFLKTDRFQDKTKSFSLNRNASEAKNWRPKSLDRSQSPCSQPSTSTAPPNITNNDKNYMIFREVTYTDSDGKLRTSMAWVPVSN